MIFSFNKFNLVQADTIVVFLALFILLTVLLFITAKKAIKNKSLIAKIWFGGWLVIASILFVTGVFGKFVNVNTVNSKEYTKNELNQDLTQLEKCLINENPLYFTNKNDLKQNFRTAYGKVKDNMTELEFYRLINPIVTSVHCGHTNLYISEALLKNREKTAKFFPLKVTLVNNKLYTVEDDPSNGIIAGDEIKQINGKTISEIIKILIDNISGDGRNEAKQRYIISTNFNSRFYDFVDNSSNFNVVLVNRKGNSKSADLQAKYREEFNTSAWELHFAKYKDGNYYDSKINNNYAVLTIHVFMKEKSKKFNAFLDDFFLKLKQQKISKLIIDTRGNFGGNPDMAQALLSHLTTEKFDYFNCDLPFLFNLSGYQKPVSPAKVTFSGKTVLLTDGACFSTAGHFCALMKYHHLATLVGSKTAGTYICTDSSKDTVLKNTRLRLHYSTRMYRVSVEGLSDQNGIEPDIDISPTIEDILNNRDIQMQRGLEALGI